MPKPGWAIEWRDQDIVISRGGRVVETIKLGEPLESMLTKIVILLAKYDYGYNPSGSWRKVMNAN